MPRSPNLPSLPFPEDVIAGKEARQHKQLKKREQTTGRRRRRDEFELGEKLLLQDNKTGLWDTTVVVEKVRNHGRSYEVLEVETGKVKLRNKKHLKSLEKA